MVRTLSVIKGIMMMMIMVIIIIIIIIIHVNRCRGSWRPKRDQ